MAETGFITKNPNTTQIRKCVFSEVDTDGMNSGLSAFTKAFNQKKSIVAGSGGVSTEDFLSCDTDTWL